MLTYPKGSQAQITEYKLAAAKWAKAGNYREAENAQSRAVAEARKSRNPICLPDELRALAKIYIAEGRYTEADDCLNKALVDYEQGREQYKGQDAIATLFDQQACETQLEIANSLRDQKRLQEAAKWYGKVFEKIKLEGLMSQRFQKVAYSDYCKYLKLAGRVQEADQLEARLKNLPDAIPDWKILLTEARQLAALGRYREEERKLTDAYSIAEALGTDEPQMATLLTYLGMVYLGKGQLSKADHFLNAALSDSYLQRSDKATALVLLARLKELSSQQSDAASLYNQAMHLEARQALATLDELSHLFADRGETSQATSTQATKQLLARTFANSAK